MTTETKMTTVITLVVIVVFAVLINWACMSSDEREIRSWASAREEQVQDVDYRAVATGPFWHLKGQRVYKVKTKNNTYWFRFGTWWNNAVYQEISEDTYKKVH